MLCQIFDETVLGTLCPERFDEDGIHHRLLPSLLELHFEPRHTMKSFSLLSILFSQMLELELHLLVFSFEIEGLLDILCSAERHLGLRQGIQRRLQSISFCLSGYMLHQPLSGMHEIRQHDSVFISLDKLGLGVPENDFAQAVIFNLVLKTLLRHGLLQLLLEISDLLYVVGEGRGVQAILFCNVSFSFLSLLQLEREYVSVTFLGLDLNFLEAALLSAMSSNFSLLFEYLLDQE